MGSQLKDSADSQTHGARFGLNPVTQQAPVIGILRKDKHLPYTTGKLLNGKRGIKPFLNRNEAGQVPIGKALKLISPSFQHHSMRVMANLTPDSIMSPSVMNSSKARPELKIEEQNCPALDDVTAQLASATANRRRSLLFTQAVHLGGNKKKKSVANIGAGGLFSKTDGIAPFIKNSGKETTKSQISTEKLERDETESSQRATGVQKFSIALLKQASMKYREHREDLNGSRTTPAANSSY